MCETLNQDIEVILINSIVNNENSIDMFLTFYEKFKNNNTFNNLLTSFFTNVFEINGIQVYIEHAKTLFSKNTNLEEFKKLKLMFKFWCENIKQQDLILTTVINSYITELNLLNKQNDNEFIKHMYLEILGPMIFKNYLKFDLGMLYETRGLFSPLFDRKETIFTSKHLNNFNNIDVYELIEIIDPLFADSTGYSDLIDYVYEILCANEQFTREDTQYIDLSKTSTISFNKFLLIILLKIYESIGVNNIVTEICQSETVSVKEYNISNLSLEQKIIVALSKAIPICHLGPIKLYHSHKKSLINQKLFLNKQSTQVKILENKIFALSSIFSNDRSNNLLQNFYVNYYKLMHTKLVIEEIFTDIILFTDFITSFSPKHNLYGFINPKLYQICSNILGNSNLTKHTRHYSAELLFKLIQINGFVISTTFFNDLFVYIGDIDYYKWMNLLLAIKHHKKILQNMIMLLDYPEKVFEQSDKVISKTLYTLLGNSIESYTQFELICEKSKDDVMYGGLRELFTDFFDIIIMTLNVYTNIYTQTIVKKSYSETEEKYSVLVHKLIESCTSEKSIINTILKNDNLTSQLLNVVYKSLYDHIDMSAKHLAKYKKVVIDGFPKSGLNKEHQEKISQLLELNFKFDMIYSDEFLDPLLFTPISEPIMLPEINEIHDRCSIVSQIHEFGENPYNRKPLSLDQLEEYNKLPEVREKINEFIKRKIEFELSL